jgi:D-alanine-D-alanine ligase-like ATP-grasp enzyme
MGHWSGKKVAVLYGGRSAEREVSLKTGEACAEALRSRGLAVLRPVRLRVRLVGHRYTSSGGRSLSVATTSS